jgi:hypothetical protein
MSHLFSEPVEHRQYHSLVVLVSVPLSLQRSGFQRYVKKRLTLVDMRSGKEIEISFPIKKQRINS